MFRATVSSIFRSTLTVYTQLFETMYRLCCLLPTGDTGDTKRCRVGTLFPKSVYIYSQGAPEDGRNSRPKHVEQD